MKLILIGHDHRYEAEKLCSLFFPHESIEVCENAEGEDNVRVQRLDTHSGSEYLTRVKAFGGELEASAFSAEDDEYAMAVSLYSALQKLTGYTPPWGLLTGVRPAKLMSSLTAELGTEGAYRDFTERLFVSPEKAALASKVAAKERVIVAKSRPESYSLYVSIPFCPSRCSYCSFVSHSNASAKKLIPQYVELLCRELELTAEYVNRLGLKLESVYYGGGTPTVLEPRELEKVMKTVNSCFHTENAEEYTLEAGRPDSITKEKLQVIKSYGATRISINPQTFNDEVLREIGRNHTAEDTLRAFKLARECGFDNINMDLIAGLPKDTWESFQNTLDTTLSLEPESVTVHTLALKRSSYIVTENRQSNEAELVGKMLRLVQQRLPEMGYEPYYMYRQSHTVGNMENVGWAKQGRECLYNVYMMEECHSILSAGAAAVTKLTVPGTGKIERIFNFKYPYEYISRFQELMERKTGIDRAYS